mmetsp:Transcript_18974/g.23343  ORF Transcript_18974/g.23343 Transcript_18974/m.23343 type:complete len:408 (-) Transcript_18974:235-1458(-)
MLSTPRTFNRPETDDHPALQGSLEIPATALKSYNFSPGPTNLPKAVEDTIQKECFSSSSSRPCSMYLSHRSPEFVQILENAVFLLRETMNIPDNYEVLFTHGGGHGQFAAVPLNLCPNGNEKVTYLVSGTWSQRAAIEAKKYCQPTVISSKDEETGTFTSFPSLDNIDPESKYVYLCSNETVNGIELHRLPDLKSRGIDAPLVVDASSDFSTKPIDWKKHNVGVLYACASKNIGHPGVTVCIVRKDLLGKSNPMCPGVFDYTTNSEAGNLWNTAATFNIEVVGIVMDWIYSNGGVNNMEKLSIQKSNMIYDLVDSSEGFFSTPLVTEEEKKIRSRMNVPFAVMDGDTAMTNKFVIEAWERGIIGLRTITPFGIGKYLRASLYNGVSLEDTEVLAAFMKEFSMKNKSC